MPQDRSTPGVFIQEVSTLPPSVAQVSTAIPAFIGYTEAGFPDKDAKPNVKVVGSLLEYEREFLNEPSGGGKREPALRGFTVTVSVSGTKDEPVLQIGEEAIKPTWERREGYANGTVWLYDAVRHYFQNGGGRCYIVSVGEDDAATNKNYERDKVELEAGLNELKKHDEPTLIVIPQAVELIKAKWDEKGEFRADYKGVCESAITHCAGLKDRFAILDVAPVPVKGNGVDRDADATSFRESVPNSAMYGAAYYPTLKTSLTHRCDDDQKLMVALIGKLEGETEELKTTVALDRLGKGERPDGLPEKLDPKKVYNLVKKELPRQRPYVELPPSAAVAGVYARVDRERGVWKAPANVALMGVIQPTVRITDSDQERLNVDENAGKSINAIRSFVGRGTLIWGARTLAGNDNEWRYIPTRRLFITIEESAKKSTSWAVFEPNDATTWLKVKGMLESYLYSLWEKGALQGSVPEDAYFVEVGLNKTMTSQDISEGRTNVSIGIAAVRPAEFIILEFSHRLASS